MEWDKKKWNLRSPRGGKRHGPMAESLEIRTCGPASDSPARGKFVLVRWLGRNPFGEPCHLLTPVEISRRATGWLSLLPGRNRVKYSRLSVSSAIARPLPRTVINLLRWDFFYSFPRGSRSCFEWGIKEWRVGISGGSSTRGASRISSRLGRENHYMVFRKAH